MGNTDCFGVARKLLMVARLFWMIFSSLFRVWAVKMILVIFVVAEVFQMIANSLFRLIIC